MASSEKVVSFYDILNVPDDASEQAIRDAIADAEEKGTVPLAWLREAKEILLNPAQRSAYDEKLAARHTHAGSVSGPTPSAFHLSAGKRAKRFSLLRVSFLLAVVLVLWWSLTIYFGYDPGKIIRTVKNRFDPAYLEMIGHGDRIDVSVRTKPSLPR